MTLAQVAAVAAQTSTPPGGSDTTGTMQDIGSIERMIGTLGVPVTMLAFVLWAGYRLGMAGLKRLDDGVQKHLTLVENTTALVNTTTIAVSEVRKLLVTNDARLQETQVAIRDHTAAIAEQTRQLVRHLEQEGRH